MKLNNSKKKTFTELDDEFNDYEDPEKWYEQVPEDPKLFPSSIEQVLIELKEEAKICHDTEVANYNIKISKSKSNFKWMKTVMSKGTVSDKIAANTVTIQDNPICNLENIRNLVGMVKVGKKKECVTVIETLTELFLSDLLRPDQKLKAFHQRPLSMLNELSSGNAVTRRKLLSYWYFEDQLKEIYASFVLAINKIAHDTVDNNKEKALTAMSKLLAGNPEQEKNLLQYIVNKLGDPSQKVASKVIYCLTQLLFKHINMQGIVLNEIEKLLFRPNISSRAQYYSLCFLSQYHLSHESSNVAKKLIGLYLSFFKACVKKGEVDSRMMSALLMGINRAYPYANIEYESISEHVDTMYRLVHLANFNISLQTLMLLYQISDFGNKITDRFYGALYRKLFDPNVLTTTHRAMLLSLIYKALLKDNEVNRLKMFIKRLLQITLYAQPSLATGILFLISQLMNKKKNLQAFVMQQSSLHTFDEDDAEEKYYDTKDIAVENVEIKEEPENESSVTQNEDSKQNSTNDTIDMSLIEVKDEDEDVKPDINELNASLNGTSSWHHAKNVSVKKEKVPTTKYDPLARNPLYGGGEFCAYMELYALKSHFHPTVALYATNIVDDKVVKYSGDPLNDFTLIRFLDRFVFKNPKKIEAKAGIHPTLAKRKLYKPKGIKLLPVFSQGYLKERTENVPVDELFLHSYLQQKYKDKAIKEEDDSDLESVQSEEFEEMIDKMIGVKDDEDEDIDFMNEIGDNLKNVDKKKKKSKSGSENNESESDNDELEDDDNDDDDDHDDDGAIEDDEISDLEDPDDEDLLAGLTDDDDEEIEFLDEEKSNKKQKSKFKKKGGDIKSLFASADEFASLLEDEGQSKVKPGGSNVYANKDNAHVKQLAWEENRNRWLKGFNKAIGSGKKQNKFGNKSKPVGNKRPNASNIGNKRKKIKK